MQSDNLPRAHDPDEPNKFAGRSEWLFYACCQMVRGGCTDEQIYAVITDPQFGISESVLDKGPMIQRYAHGGKSNERMILLTIPMEHH